MRMRPARGGWALLLPACRWTPLPWMDGAALEVSTCDEANAQRPNPQPLNVHVLASASQRGGPFVCVGSLYENSCPGADQGATEKVAKIRADRTYYVAVAHGQ